MNSIPEVAKSDLLQNTIPASQLFTISTENITKKTRLPSGFGSVRYLGKGRRCPYAVHQPMIPQKVTSVQSDKISRNSGCTQGSFPSPDINTPEKIVSFSEEIVWRRPRAICYVRDRETGIKVLGLYHAGLYKKNIEKDPTALNELFSEMLTTAARIPGIKCRTGSPVLEALKEIQTICKAAPAGQKRLLRELQPLSAKGPSENPSGYQLSLRDVYRAFYDNKFGPFAARRLSRSSRNAADAAWHRLEPFYDRPLDTISVMDLQDLVNRTASAGYSRSSVSDLVTLIRQLYRFALPRDPASGPGVDGRC